MTIRFYPSRLPGEPLETHEHGVTSIRKWLVANVEGYEDRDVPPLTVEVEGLLIPPGEWAKCVIRPDSDVRLYPVPFGLEAATIAWIGVGISVAAAAYSYFYDEQHRYGRLYLIHRAESRPEPGKGEYRKTR